MQILNLDSDFKPFGEGKLFVKKSWNFSGGEVGIMLDGELDSDKPITIVSRIRNSDDIMRTLMASSAVSRFNDKTCDSRGLDLRLFTPYLPYARQDRVVSKGESFSLQVILDMFVYVGGFSKIASFDVHSNVSELLLTGSHASDFKSYSNHAFVKNVLKDKKNYLIVAPDAGASKKVNSLADAIEFSGEIVQGIKYRISNGNIASLELYTREDITGKDLYIVDDICDGGATFVKVAEKLYEKGAANVYLIVSHYIGSKGEEPLKDGGIRHIYTTNSFKDQDTSSGFITEYRLDGELLS